MFLSLMLFVTVCLCGQLFVDIWLSVWLNAAAEQVRDSQISEQSTNGFKYILSGKIVSFVCQKC